MQRTRTPITVEEIQGSGLFASLDADSLLPLAQGAWAVTCNRGQRVLQRGDYLEGMYSVLEGRLKLYMLSCSGDERVLRVLGPGDCFGEAIMFNQIPSPVFVEALATVRLGYFPHSVIESALSEIPGFTTAMLRGMSRMMRELIQDLESCCLQNALQRTVTYLLRAAEEFSKSGDKVRLPAPKAVIASTLNMSAETFSRELHALQNAGLIYIDRRLIRLRDGDTLREIAEGARLQAQGR